MQRVTGGRIRFIDTESNRALQYADVFDFDHFPFRPPYSSLRYLEVLRAAAAEPGPIIVDSLSHEHEGEGGYIDLHDDEVERLVAKGGFSNPYAAQVPAWSLPAKNRGKLIQGITTMGINAIFCFRAKEKVSMDRKDENNRTKVDALGWMPIAGDAFVYEMTARAILLPDMPKGTPQWNPRFPGEVATCKLPGFFREYLENAKSPPQLSEDIGEKLAKWAAGDTIVSLSKEWYAKCNHDQFDELEKLRAAKWPTMNETAKKSCKADSDAAKARLGPRPTSPPPPPPPVEQPEENLDAEPPEEPYGTGGPNVEQ